MPDTHIKDRLNQLQDRLGKHNLDAVVLNPGPDLRYLTGLDFHLMERPVLLIISRAQTPRMILPELEKESLKLIGFDLETYFLNEDPSSWANVFSSALIKAGLESARLGVIPRRLRMLEYNYLMDASPKLEITSAQGLLAELRTIKDEDEVERMSEAARIAECALAAVIPAIKPGISEKELAARLVGRLFFEGSDPGLPFFPIVSFGENSANPHASPSNRTLSMGDLILIDWGASFNGYYSDITRCFFMEDLNPELEQIAQFVLEANQAARTAVKPGRSAFEIDQAARQVIDKAGYGEFFTHRTGHGLGSETHEEPYISQFDQTILQPGMTFTIEPGIYLPGRGGVRIEDDVIVTENGCHSLTDMPRELTQLTIEI